MARHSVLTPDRVTALAALDQLHYSRLNGVGQVASTSQQKTHTACSTVNFTIQELDALERSCSAEADGLSTNR